MEFRKTLYIGGNASSQEPPKGSLQDRPKPARMDLKETPYIGCRFGPSQKLPAEHPRDASHQPRTPSIPLMGGLKDTPRIECLRSEKKPPVESLQTVPTMESQAQGHDNATEVFFEHSSGQRIHTDTLITKTLREQYPNLELVVTPLYNCNLLAYAAAGHASYSVIEDPKDELSSPLSWTLYLPPARRIDGSMGGLAESLHFGKFMYKWKNDDFILYIVDGRDTSYPVSNLNNYILTTDRDKADALLLEAGKWASDLHGEVFVFDQGYWQKSAELYQSVRKSSWDAVIMDEDMKKSIIDDHLSFFDSSDTYRRLQVPWKRGIIYHGPPGNGKTISIKAMMNTLYSRADPIPTLYVRTLVSVSLRFSSRLATVSNLSP